MTEKNVSGRAAFDPAVVEAFASINRTAIDGFARLSQHFLESIQQNFDTAVETSKRLAGVKSLTELAELQTKLSQEFFTTVTEHNKTAGELGATIVRDATAHAGAQVNENVATARRAATIKAA